MSGAGVQPGAVILRAQGAPWTGSAYAYIRASDRIPTIAETPDPSRCLVRLFNPQGAGEWYIAGFDPDTLQAFGVAHILEPELGYFDLREILAYRGSLGLPVERDLYWRPLPSSVIIEQIRMREGGTW